MGCVGRETGECIPLTRRPFPSHPSLSVNTPSSPHTLPDSTVMRPYLLNIALLFNCKIFKLQFGRSGGVILGDCAVCMCVWRVCEMECVKWPPLLGAIVPDDRPQLSKRSGVLGQS